MLSHLATLLALSSLAAAQLPSSAPGCVTRCLQAKISEASFLAPGVDGNDLAGLCATSTFVQPTTRA
ncbi:hypothetical protein JCM11641_006740 [Rhodosporidiobolus odoratus]